MLPSGRDPLFYHHCQDIGAKISHLGDGLHDCVAGTQLYKYKIVEIINYSDSPHFVLKLRVSKASLIACME